MTIEEFIRIEKHLGIKLPAHYKSFLSKFEGLSHPEFEMNRLLYASADEVIEMNTMIGFHLNDRIIKNKLIIGDNGGGDFYLIDLVDQSDERVYVFDHEETVEECFDPSNGTWNWEAFGRYDTIEKYLIEMKDELEKFYSSLDRPR